MTSTVEGISADFEVTIKRAVAGRTPKHLLVVGSREATLSMLDEFAAVADSKSARTVFVDAADPGPGRFRDQIVERLQEACRSLAAAGPESERPVEIAYAATGLFSADLADLFVASGEAAAASGTAIVVAVADVHSVAPAELEALLAAAHRTNQRSLPVLLALTGVREFVLRRLGDARDYAERMFTVIEAPTRLSR